MDDLTEKQRSFCMSRIRSKHTKPEVITRKMLTSLGMRYRLHNNKLPGKPDIVISKIKTALFINGCFWHQHKGCKKSVVPKTNKVYWKEKLQKNLLLQRLAITDLRRLGWKTSIIWECQTREEGDLIKRLKKLL
ncbi:MAG: DNA mismatch endonuclease Vsr [Candidatus Shapirobacteria bacterium]